MFKAIRFIYNAGRKQAYTRILSELDKLSYTLPRNREGQLLRRDIDETIESIKRSIDESDKKDDKK